MSGAHPHPSQHPAAASKHPHWRPPEAQRLQAGRKLSDGCCHTGEAVLLCWVVVRVNACQRIAVLSSQAVPAARRAWGGERWASGQAGRAAALHAGPHFMHDSACMPHGSTAGSCCHQALTCRAGRARVPCRQAAAGWRRCRCRHSAPGPAAAPCSAAHASWCFAAAHGKGCGASGRGQA